MAVPLQPNFDGSGDPGEPGYIPPTIAGTKIAIVVTGSNITLTSDQITAAGGPWSTFTIRVTPLNDAGAGPGAAVAYP